MLNFNKIISRRKQKMNTINNDEFTDYAILTCVAKSINPYTGETMTGIDEVLSAKLKEIAQKLQTKTAIISNDGKTEYKTIKCGDFDIIANAQGQILTDIELLQTLRELRTEISKEKHIPAFCVCPNRTLVHLATFKPTTKEQFLAIKGVGDTWYTNYAHRFQTHIK